MRSFRFSAIAGVLGAVVVAVCASCSSGTAIRPVDQVTPAPTGADAASIASTGSLGGRTVVTIGDSIMAGYGLDPEDAWPTLIADQTGDTIINLGCSGAGFVAVGDCGTDFAGLIGQAAASDPSLVIVQSSDNDLDEDQDTIDAATTSTIDQLHRALPRARIVGLSTLWNQPWDAPDSIEWSSDALRNAVHGVGGTFVSIGQPLQGRDDLLQFDDEHPNELGQITLRDTILSALSDADVIL